MLAVAAALLPAPAADAATVGVANGTLTFKGGSTANQVTLSLGAGVYRVRDDAGAVSAGAGCLPAGLNQATCSAGGVTAVSIRGEGGADRIVLETPAAALGGSGTDTLVGSSGPDVFDGGSGRDAVDYSSRSEPVLVDLDGNPDDGQAGEGDNVQNDVEKVIGGSGDDRLTAIAGARTLVGGAGADVLQGGRSADTLEGGDGDDTLSGGISDDQLDGGPGADTADYSYSFDAVTVDLTAAQTTIVRGHEGPRRKIEYDDLRSLENVVGSSKGDLLIGDQGPNTLQGGSGADELAGGLGPDVLSGGAGRDVVNYSHRRAPVSVTIDDQANDGGAGEGDDVLSSTEGAIGGQGRDVLIGNAAPNLLIGGAGADLLIGLEGGDAIAGGAGRDRIDAGPGSDRVSARDGWVDRVRCGEDRDAVQADRGDRLIGCESRRAVAVGVS
jgi:Ca2+-binding RTX toxin-like protein